MFAEDLTPFFSVSEFATAGQLAGQPVRGIFDNGHALGAVGMVGMAGTQPAYTLPTASITGEACGQTLVLGATTYTVVAHEPDGAGVSRLLLEVSA